MSTQETLSRGLPPAQAEVALQLLEDREADKLALFVDEINLISGRWTNTVPETMDQAAGLSELMSRAQVALKELEALRVSRTQPLVVEQRSINGLFKTLTDPVEALIERGKRAMVAYQQAERARRQREADAVRRRQEEAARKEREALEAAEAAKTEAARNKALKAADDASKALATAMIEATLPAPRGIRTDTGTTSTTERWTFQVLKPEMVPREFLTVDDKAIRAAVAAGTREIPGVAIFLEESAQIRVGTGRNPFGGR